MLLRTLQIEGAPGSLVYLTHRNLHRKWIQTRLQVWSNQINLNICLASIKLINYLPMIIECSLVVILSIMGSKTCCMCCLKLKKMRICIFDGLFNENVFSLFTFLYPSALLYSHRFVLFHHAVIQYLDHHTSEDGLTGNPLPGKTGVALHYFWGKKPVSCCEDFSMIIKKKLVFWGRKQLISFRIMVSCTLLSSLVCAMCQNVYKIPAMLLKAFIFKDKGSPQ